MPDPLSAHECQTQSEVWGAEQPCCPKTADTRCPPKKSMRCPPRARGGARRCTYTYPKTAAPRRSSKTENVERSERTGRARETRHPSPPPATAGPHRLRRDWCLAHRLIRWTDPRTLLRAMAWYPVALPVLGANLCCLLRLPVNIVFMFSLFSKSIKIWPYFYT